MKRVLSWALPTLVIIIAAVAAVWPGGQSRTPPAASAPESAALTSARATAALAPCPAGHGDTTGPLRGTDVTCMSDGRPVSAAAAINGRPALLNLWTYWCPPCARELPVLQQFAERARGALTVVTVHSDAGEAKALSRLHALGVRLATFQDERARVRTAVGAPAAFPASVLVRADGSIAKVVLREFTSADDVAATVRAELGIAA